MSDLKLERNEEHEFDLVFDGVDLELTDDLETSVIISLFTWRRASDDDVLPSQGTDLMGSWMDKTWINPNDVLGSKLWLLGRSLTDSQLINDAKKYSEDSLRWLLEDEVAESVEVEVIRISLEELAIGVRITRPNEIDEDFKYFFNWEAQKARRI